MPSPVRSFCVAALAATVAAALAAQTTTVVPALCQNLPGNAALAMPLRWSHGTMQVFVDATLLPAALTGQAITGLRLRRSTLLGDGVNAALTRTLTVRGGLPAGAGRADAGNRPPEPTGDRPGAVRAGGGDDERHPAARAGDGGG